MRKIMINGNRATREEAMALLFRAANVISSLEIQDDLGFVKAKVDSTESIYLQRAIQCLEDARCRLAQGQ